MSDAKCQTCDKFGGAVLSYPDGTGTSASWVCPHCMHALQRALDEARAELKETQDAYDALNADFEDANIVLAEARVGDGRLSVRIAGLLRERDEARAYVKARDHVVRERDAALERVASLEAKCDLLSASLKQADERAEKAEASRESQKAHSWEMCKESMAALDSRDASLSREAVLREALLGEHLLNSGDPDCKPCVALSSTDAAAKAFVQRVRRDALEEAAERLETRAYRLRWIGAAGSEDVAGELDLQAVAIRALAQDGKTDREGT